MTSVFDSAESVLREWLRLPDAALVVLTSVTGGTLRACGAMMCVSAENIAGYISNGCVDADVIARARAGQSGTFIYGEGSPYRDIVLPCGGRLELSIFQKIDSAIIKKALSKLEKREAVELEIGDFSLSLSPLIKLRIAGRGAACIALSELAQLSGFDVVLQSPDVEGVPDAQHLIDPNNPPPSEDDAWTAVVCLFHDHDWEPALLRQALDGEAFYIGAMGSERTHEIRCQNLINIGLSKSDAARIHGPIGLVDSQRNARLLAVSILAEIIQSAQRAELL